MSRRVVVEIKPEVHKELRKLAVINDLKTYVLVNAMLEGVLSDENQVKDLLKRLKV